jgi:hypothetical protein
MEDYELSAQDFSLIDDVFKYFIEAENATSVELINARDLRERFRNAHTAKIIYE